MAELLILIGVLIALGLLAWVLGWMADDMVEKDPAGIGHCPTCRSRHIWHDQAQRRWYCRNGHEWRV